MVASVGGGARNHAELAWLTGRRVAQAAQTPMYMAAQKGHVVAIKALVAAKADVNAKDQVRYGRGGVRGRRRGVCV